MEETNKIKILPQELINQIAAGEVVERPSSVVKELVENSIDAGASEIVIEIENGGLNLIKVIDNGCGMNRTDARMSLLQHATSKIANQDDLYNIRTMGFRGEALASIAAVSEFSLVTKDKDSLAGTAVVTTEFGVEVSDVGCAKGTAVSVKNLFYNIPVRRKYLKTVVTEFNHIVDLFLNYCLAYPDIALKLVHNGKPVYHFPPIDIAQRIADVLGEEIATNLIPVEMKLNGILLAGFIGKPQIARNNRKLQYLFINRRPVNEYIIAKQIKDAFTTLIPNNLYPVFILNFEIDSDRVDVNVHPRKLEVRFSEPQIVYRTVYQAISQILDSADLVKQVQADNFERFIPLRDILETKQVSIPINYNQKPDFSNYKTDKEVDYKRIVMGEKLPIQPFPQSDLRSSDEDKPRFQVLSQVQNSYIIVETDSGIRIYDQHATSERLQYEKIKRQWEIGNLASQKMLLPQTIELSPAEGRIVNDNSALFERLGFEVSAFGGNSFAVSAVPQFLVNLETKTHLLEIIGKLEESVILDEKVNQPVDDIFKMMACKSAIKFGDELTSLGMLALVEDLELLGNHNVTCVHGRPCLIEFSYFELEKLFKRR